MYKNELRRWTRIKILNGTQDEIVQTSKFNIIFLIIDYYGYDIGNSKIFSVN